MARKPRNRDGLHYFHVLNRAAGKRPFFANPGDYRRFLQVLREGLEKYPVPIVCYCIIVNHWHLVVGRTSTNQLTKLLHWVSTTHAVRFRLRNKTVGEGPVYQGRFKSLLIEDGAALVRTCRYVERNARSAGLVRRAQDWPWGSLAARLAGDPPFKLAGGTVLTSPAWIEYVNSTIGLREQLREQRLAS